MKAKEYYELESDIENVEMKVKVQENCYLGRALVVAAAAGSRPGALSASEWAASLRNHQNYPGDQNYLWLGL